MSGDAAAPNLDEIAYWNGAAGAEWTALQEQLDRAFDPLTQPLLARADARPGEAALDIGCGCGVTTLALAGRIGTAGRVAGVDVSEPMLALARQRAHAAGRDDVAFVCADAATHPFAAGEFSLAFSRFGVMFFEDPVAAFVNIGRVLQPGARLHFACWRGLKENPWFHVPLDAVRPLVPAPPRTDPNAPGPLAFSDPNRVREVLRAAGFTGVALEPLDALLPFGEPAEAAALLTRIGPTSLFLEGAGPAQRAAGAAAVSDALSAHVRGGAVALGGAVWLVSARRN